MSEAGEATHALADQLADLRLESVPSEVREFAEDLLLDAIVCALAADHAEDIEPFARMADVVGGAGETTVIGRAEGESMAAAVMVNGFRITAVTACDVYAPAEMHAMPAVLPPLLAIAEQCGATGASLLRGVIAGLETVVRLANSFDRNEYKERGWHSPGVIGPFGGAAAAASVLGLDADGTAEALAIAGSQAAGTSAARGTPTVKFHQARAALAGATSALLAAEGFTGARRILEAEEGGMLRAYAGGDPEILTAMWGDRWLLEGISLRLWPGGARVQPTIAASQQIVQSAHLSFDDSRAFGDSRSAADCLGAGLGRSAYHDVCGARIDPVHGGADLQVWRRRRLRASRRRATWIRPLCHSWSRTSMSCQTTPCPRSDRA